MFFILARASFPLLLPKRLVLTYSLVTKVMHYQILFTGLKSSYLFLSYVQFYLGSHFPSLALAAHLNGKVYHLKLKQFCKVHVVRHNLLYL